MDGAGQLDSLIRALNDPDPAVKEAARRSLMHLGEEILPELERIHLDDPDTRSAVARVVQRLKVRRETRLWQDRLRSIPQWFADAWYVTRSPGDVEGRARLAVRPRAHETFEVQLTQFFGTRLVETRLLCRTDLYLSPLALQRQRIGDSGPIDEQAHFEQGAAIVNGSQPETTRQMPAYFLTDLSEMLVASTLPLMEGFSFTFPAVDTSSWEICVEQKLEVMGFEVFPLGETRLRCWRIRHNHPHRPCTYFISEDRALVAAFVGDEQYWLSDARIPEQ